MEWSAITKYAYAICHVIRQYSQQAVIILGTPDYSFQIETPLEEPFSAENILYSYHYYAGLHNDYSVFRRTVEKGLPIIVSEWGISKNTSGEPELDGGKEWSETVTAKAGDKVRFRIQFKNTGNTTLKNVIVRDNLPEGMTYVKGSTVLYNKANTNGKTLADGIVSKSGINIGSYDKGTEATIYFYATVNTSLKDNCEDTTLTNVVDGWYNNDTKTTESDTADTKVEGKVCEDEPEEPTPTPELPKTGPVSVISGLVGAASVATAAGYYIISRKK